MLVYGMLLRGTLLDSVRQVIAREPEGRFASFALLSCGCCLIVVAATTQNGVYAPQLSFVLGTILIILNLAEGTPSRHHRLAVTLRIIANSPWVVALVILGILGSAAILR